MSPEQDLPSDRGILRGPAFERKLSFLTRNRQGARPTLQALIEKSTAKFDSIKEHWAMHLELAE